MSRVAQTLRSRRQLNRNRREIERAITNAATPSMRDELILAAQRSGGLGHGR
jgi:hypothetical protein